MLPYIRVRDGARAYADAPPLPRERPLAVVAVLVKIARRAHGLVDDGSRLPTQTEKCIIGGGGG